MGAVELTPVGIGAADVVAVARRDAPVSISADARDAMQRGADVVAQIESSQAPAYGVSTGFGALATRSSPPTGARSSSAR